jgi:hydroxymethylpyrimidine/phosphomethylpyrimidine kinase
MAPFEQAGPSGPDDASTDDDAPPACVMTFNFSDATGAGGIAGDVATIAAMGAHPMPVVTAIVLRDTAETFDHFTIDDEVVVEQARSVLEDVSIHGWKVGFLGSAETVAAVAEILSDYPDTPLVAHLTDLSWMEDDQREPYLDAFRELILPATEVLTGNQKTLTDVLLPEWEGERPPSARELAIAASEHGTRYVLVTGVVLPARKGGEAHVDNILATAQGALAGEKFERFEASFIGAGDTLSASLAAMLAAGGEVAQAVGEALSFLDQSLDAGFRPGMGQVIPDRFFWALPPPEETEGEHPADGRPSPTFMAPPAMDIDEPEPAANPRGGKPPAPPRRMH